MMCCVLPLHWRQLCVGPRFTLKMNALIVSVKVRATVRQSELLFFRARYTSFHFHSFLIAFACFSVLFLSYCSYTPCVRPCVPIAILNSTFLFREAK